MKKVLTFLLIIFIIALFANVYVIIKYTGKFLTIEAVAEGLVSLVIMEEVEIFTINISSPENTTYNFSIGDSYVLDLNVSASKSINSWWYDLLDLKHDATVNESVIFTPNTTVNAIRWSNKLVVYANDSLNSIANSNVTFFVFVPNSAPSILYISQEIYVCEASYLSYYFNATDVDEDSLTSDISPKDPFYVFPISSPTVNFTVFEIISGNLDKDDVGGIDNGFKVYDETISVSDSEYADTKKTNITVIEINNILSMENIGVQTIWSRGENSSFYKQVQVNDVEDGNQDSGNFTFNITISNSTGDVVNLFNISSIGVMNFTANESRVGIYNISVCVNDTGIENPHSEIVSECGQDGSSITVCQNFSLTVTTENRQPTITDYYPTNLSLNVSGTDSLLFNITKYDPDETIPDAYWYVDGSLSEYDSGSLINEFTYSFGCEVSGEHTIKAEITDGLLNDSIQWNLSVSYVECPTITPAPGVGGGGKVGPVCSPKWACDDWQACQNAEKSLDSGILAGEDYRIITDTCLENNWDEKYCGFQIRNCFDTNYCNRTIKKPVEIQACYYTEKPSCHDNIKNCHDGACELLIDCGGPCLPCPTCSDGIQNQNEKGIDCGGPCPPCPVEKPLVKKPFRFVLIILVLISLVIVIIEFIKIIKFKKQIKK